jgi:hypothetical protein
MIEGYAMRVGESVGTITPRRDGRVTESSRTVFRHRSQRHPHFIRGQKMEKMKLGWGVTTEGKRDEPDAGLERFTLALHTPPETGIRRGAGTGPRPQDGEACPGRQECLPPPL